MTRHPKTHREPMHDDFREVIKRYIESTKAPYEEWIFDGTSGTWIDPHTAKES